jgi:hypothetical protein
MACGSSSGVLVGMGFGVIIVSCLTIAIYFSKVTQSENEFDEKYKRQVPQQYKGSLYNCSVCLAVFGSIATLVAIGGLIVASCLGGHKCVIACVGGAACLFTIVCIICEGALYIGYRKQQALINLNILPNSSKAQKYITEALQAFYTQAINTYKDLGGTYPYYEWAEVQEAVGSSYSLQLLTQENLYYFNYPNLWTSAYQSLKSDEQKTYFHFYLGTIGTLTDKIVYAQLGNHPGATETFPVAALQFNISGAEPLKQTYRFCWNTSRKDFSCKNLEDPASTKIFTPKLFVNDNDFLLSEYFFIKTFYNYNDIESRTNKVYHYADQIKKFPIAYHLVNKDDIQTITTQAALGQYVYFENEDGYYKVKPKSYLKHYYNQQKKNAQNPSKYKNLFWCNSEPQSFEDTRSLTDNIYKCNIDKNSENRKYDMDEFNDLSYLQKLAIADVEVSYGPEQPLREAFIDYKYGVRPKLVYSSFYETLNIFKYELDDESTIQLAFASFLIQALAVLITIFGLIASCFTSASAYNATD